MTKNSPKRIILQHKEAKTANSLIKQNKFKFHIHNILLQCLHKVYIRNECKTEEKVENKKKIFEKTKIYYKNSNSTFLSVNTKRNPRNNPQNQC